MPRPTRLDIGQAMSENREHVYPPETMLDHDGRPSKDNFSRLRSQRDEKPIILAE